MVHTYSLPEEKTDPLTVFMIIVFSLGTIYGVVAKEVFYFTAGLTAFLSYVLCRYSSKRNILFCAIIGVWLSSLIDIVVNSGPSKFNPIKFGIYVFNGILFAALGLYVKWAREQERNKKPQA